MNRYGDAILWEAGRCWLMLRTTGGQPARCLEPFVWAGSTTLGEDCAAADGCGCGRVRHTGTSSKTLGNGAESERRNGVP